MADEQEKAAVKAGAQAAHQAGIMDVRGKEGRHYAMQVHVYEDCIMPPVPDGPGGPKPSPEHEGRESVSVRLEKIEKQLQQVLDLLQKRGS